MNFLASFVPSQGSSYRQEANEELRISHPRMGCLADWWLLVELIGSIGHQGRACEQFVVSSLQSLPLSVPGGLQWPRSVVRATAEYNNDEEPGILDYAVIDWQIQQRKDRVSAASVSLSQQNSISRLISHGNDRANGTASEPLGLWCTATNNVLDTEDGCFTYFQGCVLYQSEVVEIYSQPLETLFQPDLNFTVCWAAWIDF